MRQNQRMTDPDQSHKTPVLLIGPGEPGAAPSLTLYISSGYGKELSDRLTSEGIRYSTTIDLTGVTELARYLV